MSTDTWWFRERFRVNISEEPTKDCFYQWLSNLIDNVGAEKILFATDAPYPNLMCPLKEQVKVFSEPDTNIPFTQEEKEVILGKTASKVLGL
jgi:predicted TIM-barrel fold metal-dependent hydrolase